MDGTVPLELGQLLRAPDVALREAAWDKLIASHTRLLLAVARSFGGDHDHAMERYAYILGKLRESDYQRLRAYEPERGASFPTWLTLAARRLCLDHHRARYGRHRVTTRDSHGAVSLRAIRRALNDLPVSDVDADLVADNALVSAETQTVQSERDAALFASLATLTPRERLLITLRFDDDLPASRIARVVGLPTPFHVYRQLNAIMAKLRTLLETHGIDGSDG